MSNDARGLLDSIYALGEMLAVFKHALDDQNCFSDEYKIAMCCKYIDCILNPKNFDKD